MLLWIAFACLTALVLGALMRPLVESAERAGVGADPGAADRAVYKDQLAEIESDRARGLIGPAEAEAARTEIARRLLALEEAAKAGCVTHASSGSPLAPAHRTLLAVVAMIPVAAIGVYLALGSPNLPGRPLEARLKASVDKATVDDLVAKVEARLKEHPEDGQGWDVIAPIYLRMQRFTDSADAYARAMRLLGESQKRLAGFAEASVLADNGLVGEAARRAWEKVLTEDQKRFDARFWLAVAREQDGDANGAVEAYRALAADLPPEGRWRQAVEARLLALAGRIDSDGRAENSAKPAITGAGPRPTPEQIEAMQNMSPAEREKTIAAMVDGLAARLKENGNDLGGWARLVRAYKMMGRDAEATKALASARRQFAGDQSSLAVLDALAQSLGLGS